MCFLEKVAAFTHQELNVPEWRRRDAIQLAIEETTNFSKVLSSVTFYGRCTRVLSFENVCQDGVDYFNADMQGRRKSEDRHGGLGPKP